MNEDALLPDPVGTFPEPDSRQPLSPSPSLSVLSRLGVVPSACLPIRSELFPLTPAHNSFISHFHRRDTVVWQSCSKAPNCLHKTCSLDQIITVRQECGDRTDNNTGEKMTAGNSSNSRRGRQTEAVGDEQAISSSCTRTALLLHEAHERPHMKGGGVGWKG